MRNKINERMPQTANTIEPIPTSGTVIVEGKIRHVINIIKLSPVGILSQS